MPKNRGVQGGKITEFSSKLTIEKSLDKLHHDYNSDSEEDESQNVTLEDLIAVTYGADDSMTLT